MNCPTCHEAIYSVGVGRPPTYCSVDCRREMAARRRELAALEHELAEARERLHEERWRPGRDHYWTTTMRMIEDRIAMVRPGLRQPLGHSGSPRAYRGVGVPRDPRRLP